MPINKTCYQYLYEENKNYKNDTAIIFMGKKINYNELFDRIEEVSKSLKTIGVTKGDVVTICMPNTPESAYLFYACSKIGAIADFIDPRENEEGLEKYFNISNPKHLVMLNMCFDNFKNLIEKKKIQNVIITTPLESLPYPIMFGLRLKESLFNRNKVEEHNKIMINSNCNYISYKEFIKNGKSYCLDTEEKYTKNLPVAIVHTGGTTGVPKGVSLSNDNLNELTNQIKNSEMHFYRHYLLMGVMPEFVGYGLSVGLHASLVCGMRTMMIPKYEPEKIPRLILKYKPNALAGSPAHWEIFSKSNLINKEKVDLSFLKAPIEGGDILNANVENNVNEILMNHNCKLKIQKGYGMTEKCSAATVCFNNEVNKTGSVGAPFSKTNITIYNNETNEDMYYNQVGEICINAPDVMLEYYKNEIETNKVLKIHKDNELWLHSGDLGYIDEDGILFVVGRIKDIIIRYDGIKIYPYNIESIYLKHPAIDSIAIVGKSDEEHYNGETPVAFLVIKEGYDIETTLNNIKEYAHQYVADYAIPWEYRVIDQMPTTQVGKVDKKELKNILLFEESNKRVLKKKKN